MRRVRATGVRGRCGCEVGSGGARRDGSERVAWSKVAGYLRARERESERASDRTCQNDVKERGRRERASTDARMHGWRWTRGRDQARVLESSSDEPWRLGAKRVRSRLDSPACRDAVRGFGCDAMRCDARPTRLRCCSAWLSVALSSVCSPVERRKPEIQNPTTHRPKNRQFPPPFLALPSLCLDSKTRAEAKLYAV